MTGSPAPAAWAPWRRQLALTALGLAFVLAGHVLVLTRWPDAHLLMIDLQVYRAGGEHLLRGEPLYAGGVLLDLPFVYPPFAAALFAPLTLLPLGVLKVSWTMTGVGLLGYTVHRCRGDGGRAAVGLALVLAVVLTGLDPVRTTLYLGQINLVLLALVVADILGRRPRGSGEADPAGLRGVPGADRASAGRRDRARDVRRGRGRRVPARPGGLGRLLVRRDVRRR